MAAVAFQPSSAIPSPPTGQADRVGLHHPDFNSGFPMIDTDVAAKSGPANRVPGIPVTRPRKCKLHDPSALPFVARGAIDRLEPGLDPQNRLEVALKP
jgi:hypothetical protein